MSPEQRRHFISSFQDSVKVYLESLSSWEEGEELRWQNIIITITPDLESLHRLAVTGFLTLLLNRGAPSHTTSHNLTLAPAVLHPQVRGQQLLTQMIPFSKETVSHFIWMRFLLAEVPDLILMGPR